MVYRTAVNRHLYNFGTGFGVNLKRGENLLLVKVSQREEDWSMFVGIDGFEDIQAPDVAADVKCLFKDHFSVFLDEQNETCYTFIRTTLNRNRALYVRHQNASRGFRYAHPPIS